MILQALINFMFPESVKVANALLHYNGMRTLFVYHQLGDIQIRNCMEYDLGEEPWTFLTPNDSEIIKNLRSEFGTLSVDLEFNALNLSIVNKDTKEVVVMFFGGSAAQKPNWDIDGACYLELTPEEWEKVQKAASLVGKSKHRIYEGVSFALSGTLLEVSAANLTQKNNGLMVSMLFNLPSGLDDDSIGLGAIVPAEAIKLMNGAPKSPVSLEIGADRIVITQGTKSVCSPLISGDYPPIGLIPDGEIKAQIDFEKLRKFAILAKLRTKESSDKIVIEADIATQMLKMSAFERKANVDHCVTFPLSVYQAEDEYDGPKAVTCYLAQSALLEVVRLIRPSYVILSVPIDLQALTILAGATRIVLPTVVREAVDLNWENLKQLEPLVKGRSFTEIDISKANHSRRIEVKVEKIESTPADDLLEEPSSVDEALGQLQRSLTKGRKALENIHANTPDRECYEGLKTEASECLEKAVRFGTSFTNQVKRNKKSPWDDPADIHRITRAIVLSAERAESFTRNTQAWKNQFTFTFVD